MLNALLVTTVVNVTCCSEIGKGRGGRHGHHHVHRLRLHTVHSRVGPRFVFGTLDSVRGLVGHSTGRRTGGCLVSFSHLLQGILTASRGGLIPLSSRVRRLRLCLGLRRLHFPFSCSLAMSGGVRPSTVRVPKVLVRPFIRGTIGRKVTPHNAKRVVVQLSLRSRLLIVSVVSSNPKVMARARDNFNVHTVDGRFRVLGSLCGARVNVAVRGERGGRSISNYRIQLSVPLWSGV